MASAASRPSRIAQTTRLGAAHDVAGGEHAGQARSSCVRKSAFTVPQRRHRGRLAERAGRSSGSKPSALITRSASSSKSAAARSSGAWRPEASGGPSRMRARAHAGRRRRSPRNARGAASHSNTRLLPRRCRPRAPSPACWPGRAGRGRSPTPRPGAPRCARSPSRCRRRRPRRRACPRRSARRRRTPGTASPRPLRLRGDQVVQRRHDARRARARTARSRAL